MSIHVTNPNPRASSACPPPAPHAATLLLSNNKNLTNKDIIISDLAKQAESTQKIIQSTKELRAVAESIGSIISKHQQEKTTWATPAIQKLKDTVAPIENIGKAFSKQQQEIATLIAPAARQMTSIQQALQPVTDAITPISNMVSTWHEMFKPLQEAISLINVECFSVFKKIENKFHRLIWKGITNLQTGNCRF